jgi:hypothetical protein
VNPRLLARMAGLLYIAQLVLSGFSQAVARPSVLVAGDPAATADKIRSGADLYRAGLVTDLIGLSCYVGVALCLFFLLRATSTKAAVSMLAFVCIGAALGIAALVNTAASLVIATGNEYALALGSTQRDALAYLFNDLYQHGYHVAQIFYGLWLFPAGYLVYKSGWFPRWLGVLVVIGGVSQLAELAIIFSSNAMTEGDVAIAALLPATVAELAFMFWLALRGANVDRVGAALPA